MTSLQELRNRYLAGAINKPEYIQQMYSLHHAQLFEYARYISQTDVASIEIREGKVIMTSKRYGVMMICPEGDHRVAPIESLNFMGYEEAEANMILRLVPTNGIVFDIGANMGWYSLLIAHRSKNCMVHAFEPIPSTYSCLEQNIRLNQFQNIEAHNFGISDARKELTFYFYPEGSGNASSENLSERSDAELVTCHVERLDDFVRESGLRVDFIKCDVEGAELFAFLGATEMLNRDKPIVFTEMLRKWAAKFNYHPNEIILLFRTIGYECYFLSGDGLAKLEEMTEETTETNFFFLHNEKHAAQIKQLATGGI